MFKFIFALLTDPLGLPIEWYWEYLILLVIGAATYPVAYRCVDGMYSGGIIAAIKWLTNKWMRVLSILGGVIAAIGIASVIAIILCKHKNKSRLEVSAYESN